MIKEFEINDILNAVNKLSKEEVQTNQIKNEKNNNVNSDNLTHSNQEKLNKIEVLVLDQMIE